eukprot:CAMPEP_0115092322 /NCGR_PEP_ID=MMETSP0227-20121206/26692_1 /TAXON_ID=89957 /ORGANISM="Polarella glacialis, Strain CCMP 1383" /LENGTH=98 /DNA_ID=CAMNT_0002484109 /DNA_START=182 /DNA_END=478 /DNA_ORIENTATION=+
MAHGFSALRAPSHRLESNKAVLARQHRPTPAPNPKNVCWPSADQCRAKATLPSNTPADATSSRRGSLCRSAPSAQNSNLEGSTVGATHRFPRLPDLWV